MMKRNVLLLVFSLSILTHYLQAQDFSIQTYHVDIHLKMDGSAEIEEQIKLIFHEERRGIIRRIPKSYSNQNEKVRLGISKINVDSWNYEVEDEDGYKFIRIGDPDTYIKGVQRYQISYKARNAILWIDKQPNFYWNVMGPEWGTTTDAFSFTIHYPEDIELRTEDISVFSGKVGSRSSNAVEWRNDLDMISGKSAHQLQPYEAVTVGFPIPNGHFDVPLRLEKGWNRNFGYGFPIGLLGLLILLFRKQAYQPKLSVHSAEMSPYVPDKMSPEEAGMHIDGIVHTRDLVSLIPWWANKGYLTITGIASSVQKSDLLIEKTNDLDPNLPKHQHILFNGLFKTQNAILLSDLKETGSSDLYRARVQLGKFMRSSYLYDQGAVVQFWKGWIALFGLVFIAAAIVSGVVFAEYLTALLLGCWH